MLIIDHVLVSDEVLTTDFACAVRACKGACCWEGDFGAPLDAEERTILEAIYPNIREVLSPEGRAVIEDSGTSVFFEGNGKFGTPLLENGACAYLTFEEGGVARCGIERAAENGLTDFPKPVSCQLYPIRIERHEKTGFETMNYDQWEICSAACDRGRAEGIPLYEFVREAIVRKYDEEFFEQLAGAAQHFRDGHAGEMEEESFE